MKKLLTILICALSLTATAGTAKKVDLKYNLKTGAEYKMVMHSDVIMNTEVMGNQMDVDMSMDMGLVYTVLSEMDEGYKMEFIYDNMAMRMKTMGQEMNYNSEDPNDPMGMGKVMAEMKNKPMSITLSKKGKVMSVDGIEAMFESIIESMEDISPEMMDQIRAMEKSYGEETMKSNIQMAAAMFPENPVRAGDKWDVNIDFMTNAMPIKVKMVYEYKGIKDGYNIVSFVAEMLADTIDGSAGPGGIQMSYNLNGTMSGEMKLDKETGWPHEAYNDMEIGGNVVVSPNAQMPEGMNIPLKMKMKVKITDK